ncbi:MAG: hypothetical protein HGB06_07450 [Chlorobaculum sp.]|nr:hypothetical protein [Chlorobaculum sp.]
MVLRDGEGGDSHDACGNDEPGSATLNRIERERLRAGVNFIACGFNAIPMSRQC